MARKRNGVTAEMVMEYMGYISRLRKGNRGSLEFGEGEDIEMGERLLQAAGIAMGERIKLHTDHGRRMILFERKREYKGIENDRQDEIAGNGSANERDKGDSNDGKETQRYATSFMASIADMEFEQHFLDRTPEGEDILRQLYESSTAEQVKNLLKIYWNSDPGRMRAVIVDFLAAEDREEFLRANRTPYVKIGGSNYIRQRLPEGQVRLSYENGRILTPMDAMSNEKIYAVERKLLPRKVVN